MSLILSRQVPSNFIIQPFVSSQCSCSHLSIAYYIFKCCIFFEKLGTNPSIVFKDKESCDQEDKKKRAFVDAKFSHLDGAQGDDDHSWCDRTTSGRGSSPGST
jgi:hypothetical protein